MANNELKYIRIDPALRNRMRAEWNVPVLWPLFALFAVLVISAVPAVISYVRRERRVAK